MIQPATTSPKIDDRGGNEPDPKLYAARHVDEGYRLNELTDDLFAEQYAERGYVAVRDFFSADMIDGARQALIDLVAGRNPAFDPGELQLEQGGAEAWAQLPIERREDFVRKLMYFVKYDARLAAVCDDPSLQARLRMLMDGATPKIFQEMALIKPPHIGREKPWHQDHAYFRVPLDTPIVGCWIALDPATVENGCMHVLPGAHKLGPIEHHKVRDWQICDHLMVDKPGCTAVPLPPGGVLFFSSLLPHGTPTNRSPHRRRALQYHYAPLDHPTMRPEDHKAIFGDQAGDIPC